jgi:hypothetical protein
MHTAHTREKRAQQWNLLAARNNHSSPKNTQRSYAHCPVKVAASHGSDLKKKNQSEYLSDLLQVFRN